MEELAARLAALELEHQELRQQNQSLKKKLGQRVKAETGVGVQVLTLCLTRSLQKEMFLAIPVKE
eukprot:9436839-Karenia_brevis.AAC.1